MQWERKMGWKQQRRVTHKTSESFLLSTFLSFAFHGSSFPQPGTSPWLLYLAPAPRLSCFSLSFAEIHLLLSLKSPHFGLFVPMLKVIPLLTRDTLFYGSDYTCMTNKTWRKGLNSPARCPASSSSIFTYSDSPPSLLWKSHWTTPYLWLSNMLFTLPKGNLSLQLKYTLNSLALAPQQVSEATWWRLVGVADSQPSLCQSGDLWYAK